MPKNHLENEVVERDGVLGRMVGGTFMPESELLKEGIISKRSAPYVPTEQCSDDEARSWFAKKK